MRDPYALPLSRARSLVRFNVVAALLLAFLLLGMGVPCVAAAGTSNENDLGVDGELNADAPQSLLGGRPNLHWVGFASVEVGLRTVHGEIHVPRNIEGGTSSSIGGLYVDWQAAGYGSTSLGRGSGSAVNAGPFADHHVAADGCCNIVAAFDSRGKEQRELLESSGATGYPVLGDSSELSTDAVSRAPVYLFIERGPTYLLYGDYHTDLTDGQLVAYDRRLTGLKVRDVTESDGGRLALTAMAAVSKQSTFTDVLPSAGVAGFYRLTHGNVVPNSERVTIAVVDSEGAVVETSARPLQRDLDYVIDYFEGMLLLKQPLPIVDARGNVYQIVVRYEYEADLAAAMTLASRLAYEGQRARIGVTTVAEGTGEGGNTARNALGIDAAVRLATWLQAEVEWATSRLTASGTATAGDAYRLALSGDLRPDLAYHVSHSKQGATFAHLHSQTFTGQGEQRTNAQLTYRPALDKPGTSLSATLGYEAQRMTPATSTVVGLQSGRSSVGITYGIDRWTLRGNVESGTSAQTGAGNDRWTRIGYGLGASYRFAAGHSAGIFRDGSTSVSSVTNETDAHGVTGINYNHRLDERTDWTAGYARADGGQQRLWTGVAHRFVDTDTLTSNVYTRYQLDGTLSENRTGTAFGINNRWRVTRTIAVDFGYERAEGIANKVVASPATSPVPAAPPGTPSTTPSPARVQEAWNVAFSFVPELPYRLAFRYSTNATAGTTKQLIQLSALGQISQDISVSGALLWSTPATAPGKSAVGVRQQQTLGVAYRPVYNSRFNALALFERDVSRASSGSQKPSGEAYTVSAEASYWVTAAFEFATKVAQRSVMAHVPPAPEVRTSTRLYQVRGTTVLAPRWDTTVVLRRLQQQPTERQPLPLSQTGWQASVGYSLIESDPRWKVDAGYRYADYAPEDDPSEDAYVTGPFVRLTYRF